MPLFERYHIKRTAGPSPRCVRLGLLLFFGLALPELSTAQFLRIGPFDFTARTTAGLSWSDNVDGVRPAAQDKRPDDFFLTWSLELVSNTPVGRDANLAISAGVDAEDYFTRDDLDIADLGHFRADLTKSIRRLRLMAGYSWEHTLEMSEDIYFPGLSRFTRNPNTLTTYEAGAEWVRNPLTLRAEYSFSEERYDYDQFKVGDNDETSWKMSADWKVGTIGSISYEVEKTLTEYINKPDDDPEWDSTEKLNFNFANPFRLLRRPLIVFSAGVEREDDVETGEKGEWDPIYSVDISDKWEIGSRLSLSAHANYEYDQDPESDDTIGWLYDIRFDHALTPRARQSLSFKREPRDTFNSKADTDTTTYEYAFVIEDLLIIGLKLDIAASYEVNEPTKGPTEKLTTYDVSLSHAREISSRLRRIFAYMYSMEESNLEDELLIENLVEWKYSYDL